MTRRALTDRERVLREIRRQPGYARLQRQQRDARNLPPRGKKGKR